MLCKVQGLSNNVEMDSCPVQMHSLQRGIVKQESNSSLQGYNAVTPPLRSIEPGNIHVKTFPCLPLSVSGDMQALDLCKAKVINSDIQLCKQGSDDYPKHHVKTAHVPFFHSNSLPADLSIVKNEPVDGNQQISKMNVNANRWSTGTSVIVKIDKVVSQSEICLPPKKRKMMLAQAINELDLNSDPEQCEPVDLSMDEPRHSHEDQRTVKRKLSSESSGSSAGSCGSISYHNQDTMTLMQPLLRNNSPVLVQHPYSVLQFPKPPVIPHQCSFNANTGKQFIYWGVVLIWMYCSLGSTNMLSLSGKIICFNGGPMVIIHVMGLNHGRPKGVFFCVENITMSANTYFCVSMGKYRSQAQPSCKLRRCV